MLNLLGYSSDAKADFLKPDGVVARAVQIGAAVHLYGKAGCRKGRKMGHITVMGNSDSEVKSQIEELCELLPGTYADKRSSALVTPEAPFNSLSPLVSIVMGSDSDLPVMKPAAAILSSFKIPFELSIVSAHRTVLRMEEFAHKAAGRGVRAIIAGAGGAAHLPGMVASSTTLPVIGVPVKGSVLDGVDSLHSIVQMPVCFLFLCLSSSSILTLCLDVSSAGFPSRLSESTTVRTLHFWRSEFSLLRFLAYKPKSKATPRDSRRKSWERLPSWTRLAGMNTLPTFSRSRFHCSLNYLDWSLYLEVLCGLSCLESLVLGREERKMLTIGRADSKRNNRITH